MKPVASIHAAALLAAAAALEEKTRQCREVAARQGSVLEQQMAASILHSEALLVATQLRRLAETYGALP